MKEKLLCLGIALCFCCPLQIHAAQHCYLISSAQMPYLIFAAIQDTDTITMYIIPDNLIVKDGKIDREQDEEENRRLIEANLHLSADASVNLHLDAIQKDMGIAYDDTTFTSLHTLCDYFAAVRDEVSIIDLFHYQRYLDSSLQLADYYQLYQLMKQADLHIRYAYLNYLPRADGSIPLDMSFHTTDNNAG